MAKAKKKENTTERELTKEEKDFQKRREQAESRLRGIQEDLELGVKPVLYLSINGQLVAVDNVSLGASWSNLKAPETEEEESEEESNDEGEDTEE